jgi:hypothetical protein
MMAMPLFLLILMLLSACTSPQHPLTYVHPNDPVWSINPAPPPAAAPMSLQNQANAR